MTAIVQAFRQDTSLDRLWEDVQGAQPEISFWGHRYIRCKNGDTLLFSTLMERAEPYMSRNLPEQEREKARKIVWKIEDFFSYTEMLLPHINTVAKRLIYFRESLGANGTYSRWLFMKSDAYQLRQGIRQNEGRYWNYFRNTNTLAYSKHTSMDVLEALLPPCIGEISPL